MKFIFLYSSRGARNHNKWNSELPAKSSMVQNYISDGYAYVGDRLIEKDVVDEVLCFVEVGRGHGRIKISDKHTVYAIPYITCIEPYIEPGDILFIRGCWKHWAEILHRYCKTNWMIYYGAGTPRSGWGCWHVVMYDFINKAKRGKLHLTVPFIKPIHYKVFYPMMGIKKEYDILLNSCFHIYDKKGQYKFVNAAVKYKELYGENLKIAMPGGMYRNTHTSKMPQVIEKNKLDIYRPGTLSRPDLNELINKCLVYIHIGYGEQNARSALEAMRCNLPLYIASPRLWPKFVSSNPQVTRICKNPNDYSSVAQDIHQILADIKKGTFGIKCTEYFDSVNSPEITVKQFEQLITIMKRYSTPTLEKLQKDIEARVKKESL